MIGNPVPPRLLRHLVTLAVGATLTVSAMASVRGTVITADGAALAGADVRVIEPDYEPASFGRWISASPEPVVIAESSSDAKGNFTVEVPAEVTVVDLVVTAPAMSPVRLRVPNGGDIGAVALERREPRTGTVREGSSMVAGATVVFLGHDGAELVVQADEAGRFSVPDPSGWVRSIAVHHPEHAPIHRAWQRTDGLDLRLERGVAIRGAVLDEDGETPVAGARVLIDGWPLAESSEEGTFEISHAPSVWRELGALSGGKKGTLLRSAARGTAVVKLAPAAAVVGSITDLESGRGVVGAVVSIVRVGAPGQPVSTTLSDSDGSYRLAEIAPGSYSIQAAHPRYVAERVDFGVPAPGEHSRPIALRQGAVVSGKVQDERGRGVGAARLGWNELEQSPFLFRASWSGSRHSAWSAPDGRFVLFGVPAETMLSISAAKRGFPLARTDEMELRRGDVGGIILTIPEGVKIEGIVRNRAGDAIRDAAVRVYPSARTGAPVRMIVAGDDRGQGAVATNREGEFVVRVEPGPWDLSVHAPGYASTRINAVEAGGTEPVEITLDEGAEIRGRVVRAGIGVADVGIAVMQWGGGPVLTGPDGSFTIPDLPEGPVTLLAIRPEEHIQQMLSTTAPQSDLVIELPRGGTIRGRVIDAATKEPVRHFEAGASPERGGGVVRVQAPQSLRPFQSEDGSFVLENVPPGRLRVTVRAGGYLDGTASGIEVAEGAVGEIDVSLDRGVRLTGMVQGPDGRPLGGVRVSISEEEDDFRRMIFALSSDATTDSSGRYVVEAVEPGEATISFSRDGYQTLRKSAEMRGRETRVDARLTEGRAVAGVVVSEDGQPIHGATVRVRSAVQGATWKSAETDAGGRFSFQGLEEGRYGFQASHHRYVDTERNDVDIRAAGEIRLVMKGGGAIAGRVVGLEPREYGSVRVTAVSSGTHASAQVSSDGRFRIDGVHPGSATVSAQFRQAFAGRSTAPVTVEVAAGVETSVDLRFEGGVTVRGRVTRQGEPLRSGIINFVPADRREANASSVVESNGDYTVSGLARGIYEVHVVDMETRAPFTTTTELRSDSERFDIDIRGSRVQGRVTDASTGGAVEGVAVTLDRTDAGGSRRMSRFGGSSGSSGEFVIDSVPAGSYRLRAEKAGYGHEILDVVISEGRGERVDLALQPTEGLLMRVVDARGGQPLSASFWVTDPQGRTVWEGRPSARADGTVRIPVSAGSYSVRAVATGYAAQTVQVTSPGPTHTVALTIGGAVVVESRRQSAVQARLLDQNHVSVRSNPRNPDGRVSIHPGSNRFDNLHAGTYTLQILGETGAVESTVSVVVREGESVSISI
jgi:large repetitive protein